MNYDEFIETQELMIQYAQKAIDIYDELYDQVDVKYKGNSYGTSIISMKSMFGCGPKKKYIADEDDADFDKFGITFTEEDYFCGETETNTINIPSKWIIHDEVMQRKLIEADIKAQCNKVKEFLDERERKAEEFLLLKIKEKEKRDREEYLRLKKKFEDDSNE